MRQGGLILVLAAGRVRSKKKKDEKITPPKAHHDIHSSLCDRDHLETAYDETRPTRSPTLARIHRFRVCGNRPRTALAISKNDECCTYTQTDGQTN